MTPPPRPRPPTAASATGDHEFDELDQLASDALDEPTLLEALDPDRRAEVEDRLTRLRPARQALSQPMPGMKTTMSEQMVRRAVAAGPGQSVDPDPAPVGSARRSLARAPGRSPVSPWLAAAAVVVLVVAVALLARHVLTTGTANTSTAASARTTTNPAAAGVGAAPTPAFGSADSQGATADLDALPDLGSAANAAALRRLASDHLASHASGSGSASGSSSAQSSSESSSAFTPEAGPAIPGPTPPHATHAVGGCRTAVSAGRTDLGPLVLDARATLAGRAVEVLVFAAASTSGPTGSSAGQHLLAVTPGTCQIVVDLAG